MNSPNEYVLAGGGTGGHLFPGLAVAAALRAIEPDAVVTFFTTTRALDRDLLARTPYGQVQQTVRPLTVRPWRIPAFLSAWFKNVAAASAWLKDHQPRAVLGLGGYAAGPPVAAARRLGIRTAILNPDAIPGRANRFLASRVDLAVLQWDVTRRYLSKRTHCHVLGCPIRAEFARPIDAGDARRSLGLDPNRPLLLVTGASQGARSVNQTVCRVWPEFQAKHPDWQLLHLTGAADEAETRRAYGPTLLNGTGTSEARGSVRVVAFMHEMWLALAAADLVVSRAGASTLAEITALGKPAILLPYPYHKDRHQHANAKVLVDAGAAVLIDDQKTAEANHRPLADALERLADGPTRQQMAQAARTLGRPAAARDVAAWLAGRRAAVDRLPIGAHNPAHGG
ncbi:MAG: UDP-N-acetylglucosamine--N-acetylmuramyl-(pentapeptide) pyrophosphoryl-undecaprenol N-acetylglucosamine transferase [Phycisphaerae bacterium]|jgi:UDP-N-acetylglucosamine--N-acetylmuramyl-(pentapeptide) pyrophosphoryl-undecaprenol N-acetylglucosamine transferase|nr:UDP-N-acetylglucosamine--N-acetylmuramyl-(pentapeptide) pyrophosphoryl-undecaprenol N-acetylglucosamine transferase [Phycisphaerae bacterium]HOO16771.1 UDP-N-acetylglucosamine--N-acetylmuramyl-(pentapeptide) pyrophosphoryl-undecaprenol N-acetylglucosamine transferase [Phycisphaerae bacterium]HPC22978.1 UDP-N-acetylglucosamine--N-acetylmuramyl-(pentapeptide) pyrophosphoryl-undecaprenol N-acetylglucosamine transferase [Phycisphaerae bacterium]HRS28846.1 UDP-N-acetylglucosamine--N-acetylmuramyl-